MEVKIDMGSLRASLKNMGKVSDEVFEKASKAALKAAGGELRKALIVNVSLNDHSLRDLAILDHPYARRHGSIQLHTDKPYQVHKQSGRMAGATTGRLVMSGSRNNWAYRVGFKYDKEYQRYVVEGTTKMIGRDVVWRTSQEEPVRIAMMRAIVKTLGAHFRTGAGVRFG